MRFEKKTTITTTTDKKNFEGIRLSQKQNTIKKREIIS